MDSSLDFPLIHLSSDFIRAKEYLEAIVSSSPDAICTTDMSGKFIYFSPGAEEMIGIQAQDMGNRYAHEIYQGGIAEARKIMRLLTENGQIKNHETVVKGKNGRIIYASLAASLLKDRRGNLIGTLGIFKDISVRVHLERKLQDLCRTDNLTGLFNRRHFDQSLKQEWARAKRQNYPLSLVLMDLNDFKTVNDSKGHKAGDRILKSFSALLRDSLRREADLVFRFGGDEFTAVLPGLKPHQADQVMKKVLHRARKFQIRFSYGIAGSSDVHSIDKLIQTADAAMYRMKKTF